MNQWIYLAQAATGHANGKRYEKALEALRGAGGSVVIPLASAHYMEVDGIRDAGRRSNLATLMDELSGFVCIMPRSSVVRVELGPLVASPKARRSRQAA